MNIFKVPYNALILPVGPSGSGKSSFMQRCFKPTEIVSSDVCRGLVCDDTENQDINGPAFTVFHTIIEQRLSLNRLVVADATNLKKASRDSLFALAEKYGRPVVGIIFDTPLDLCKLQNQQRGLQEGRFVPEDVIEKHHKQFQSIRTELSGLFTECFSVEPLQQYKVVKDSPYIASGWDVIADLHGCLDELVEILCDLGYQFGPGVEEWGHIHDSERKLAFVGDFTDRGYNNHGVLHIVMEFIRRKKAVAVSGNHDNKLWRCLNGNKVTRGHGLHETMIELESKCSPEELNEIQVFLQELPYLLQLETFSSPQKLVIAHAGIDPELVSAPLRRVRERCLYGIARYEDGHLVRERDWMHKWEGVEDKVLVYGHDWGYDVHRVGNAINIDTGAVFGNFLTAFSFPEFKFTQVKSAFNCESEENDRAIAN